MIGSVYFDTRRVSDAKLVHMSGIDTYLNPLVNEFNMKLAREYD